MRKGWVLLLVLALGAALAAGALVRSGIDDEGGQLKNLGRRFWRRRLGGDLRGGRLLGEELATDQGPASENEDVASAWTNHLGVG